GGGILKTTQVSNDVNDLCETHLPLAVLGGELADTAAMQELAVTLYVIHGEDKYIQTFRDLEKQEDRAFKDTKKLLSRDPDLVKAGWPALVDEAAGLHDRFVEAGNALIDAARAKDQDGIARKADDLEAVSQEFHQVLKKFQKINTKEAHRVAMEAARQSSLASATMKVMTLMTLLAGVILAFFITRGITRPIRRIIGGLNEAAYQVVAAAEQVSSASQSLAEGSSEQASSIEETSSSLEEMSSMIKQNADNAETAKNLRAEAYDSMKSAKTSMKEAMDAMSKIMASGEEIGKIIKTIDEIAFQTNLLALNAAVEAARAGEAGAGFAVVADEVRNLAMRVAEAAKNTQALIERTVSEINIGSGKVEATHEAFEATMEHNKKVGKLIDEIAAASREQAQGIEQINFAVSEMDKVVQQNAANAEESASASEEMNAQAEQMKASISGLAALIGNIEGDGDTDNRKGFHAVSSRRNFQSYTISDSAAEEKNFRKTFTHDNKEIDPDKSLPITEQDLLES
ncbi:MAG: hypothetical protein JRJ78_16260, partial [Deltaproteobacteria bacterium]|nr:hypothetical protein [Deltaproteobacteria bacterium]